MALQEAPARGQDSVPKGCANPSCIPACPGAGQHSNSMHREYCLDADHRHFPGADSSAHFLFPAQPHGHLDAAKGPTNPVSHSPHRENLRQVHREGPKLSLLAAESSPKCSKFPSAGGGVLPSFFFLLLCKSTSFYNYVTAKKHLKNLGLVLLFYQTFSPLVFPHNCCHPLACQSSVRWILSVWQLSR